MVKDAQRFKAIEASINPPVFFVEMNRKQKAKKAVAEGISFILKVVLPRFICCTSLSYLCLVLLDRR